MTMAPQKFKNTGNPINPRYQWALAGLIILLAVGLAHLLAHVPLYTIPSQLSAMGQQVSVVSRQAQQGITTQNIPIHP